MIEMVEVVRRCPYCGRENLVSPREYDENPFCQRCLSERLEKASITAGPMRWEGDCGYVTLVPIEQKGSRDTAKR
jgi:hypothetical protein